jgi:nicotinate-nucleotide adenylyltransferase
LARRPIDSAITPLPVPRTARTLLLVGGTFDPPHAAHVDLPRAIRKTYFGDSPRAWLVYVPAARSPFKAMLASSGNSHRVNMLSLAIRGVPRAAIWTDEIDRASGDSPSFWIETVSRAARVAPPLAELRFIIGSDQAALFHKWKRFREILDIAEPIVLLRDPHRTAADVVRALKKTRAWTRQEIDAWRSWVFENPLAQVSSTLIREALRAGRFDNVNGAIRPSVLAYIRRRSLYGTPARAKKGPATPAKPRPRSKRRRTSRATSRPS